MNTLRFKVGDAALLRRDTPTHPDYRKYLGSVLHIEGIGHGPRFTNGTTFWGEYDYAVRMFDGLVCGYDDPALDPLTDPDQFNVDVEQRMKERMT
jgi:hypothetical protein